jgi:hypothetical protein
MADASLTQTLLSGAVGALGTAALAYIVQVRLAHRAKRREEKNMAYIHFTRVSSILAAGELVKIYGKAYEGVCTEVAKSAAQRGENPPDVAHFLAVYLHSAIKQQYGATIPGLRHTFKTVAAQLEEALGFSIPIDQLAKLPHKTILHYNAFVEASKGIKTLVQRASEFINGEVDLRPVDFFMQWFQLKQYYEIAVKLCAELRAHGKIPKEEADKVLAFQKAQLARFLAERTTAEPKLAALVPLVEAAIKNAARKAADAAANAEKTLSSVSGGNLGG